MFNVTLVFIITYFKLIVNQNKHFDLTPTGKIITYFKLIVNQNLLVGKQPETYIITYFKLIVNQNYLVVNPFLPKL